MLGHATRAGGCTSPGPTAGFTLTLAERRAAVARTTARPADRVRRGLERRRALAGPAPDRPRAAGRRRRRLARARDARSSRRARTALASSRAARWPRRCWPPTSTASGSNLDHGYPLRLIAPDRAGVLNTKWLIDGRGASDARTRWPLGAAGILLGLFGVFRLLTQVPVERPRRRWRVAGRRARHPRRHPVAARRRRRLAAGPHRPAAGPALDPGRARSRGGCRHGDRAAADPPRGHPAGEQGDPAARTTAATCSSCWRSCWASRCVGYLIDTMRGRSGTRHQHGEPPPVRRPRTRRTE